MFEDFRNLDVEYKEGIKARMYCDEADAKRAKPTDALILNIERMSFLPQEIISQLYKIASEYETDDSDRG